VTNAEMIIIIECWTVHFYMYECYDLSGGVRVVIKFGTRIANRTINYQSRNDAVQESFDKAKRVVMAVCGDIERSRVKDES
jgi:hypothetical protein